MLGRLVDPVVLMFVIHDCAKLGRGVFKFYTDRLPYYL